LRLQQVAVADFSHPWQEHHGYSTQSLLLLLEFLVALGL
jgi:hypothetical protein